MAELIVPALIVGGSVAIASEVQRKEASKARSAATAAEKKRQQFIELQAGEYEEIGKQQMAIQALQSQTETLVEVLDRQKPAPRIYTLPAVESTDPVQRINKAIDDFVRGSYG